MALQRIATVAIGLIIAGIASSACVSNQAQDEDGGLSSPAKSEDAGGVNPDLANEELASDASPPAAPKAAAAPSEAGFQVEVTDLRYKSNEGGGTVVIETSSPATFRTREVPSLNQAIIEIANAHLPDRFKRPYSAKEFKQEIASINGYQDAGSFTARVVVQFRGPASASVRQDGRRLLVTYAPPGAGGSVADQGLEQTNSGSSGSYAVEHGRAAAPEPMSATSFDESNGSFTKFYGKPISLEARDAPIREVVSAIADQIGVNIILSDEVKEKRISLKLRQVPWDQALLLIMKAEKLSYVRQGSVLRIASLETLRTEAEETKKVLDAERRAQPFKTKIVPISYAKVADVITALKPFVQTGGAQRPYELQAAVVADARTSSVIITDIPENIDRMVAVIKALDTPPLQVLIEAKVLEASEKFQRSMGINWGVDGAPSPVGAYTASPNGPTFNNLTAATSNNFGISIGTFDVLGNINAAIGLGESQDLVHILSSPRIVTLNNVEASIKQSINIPIPQQVVAATGSPSTISPVVGYGSKSVALTLKVTPQITAESDVIMAVDLAREFVPSGLPSATSNTENREAHTTVLVKNGQTAVIGGVYQNDAIYSEQGMPLLKDIPVLGYLFKGTNKTKTKNELLLFLTPRILNAEKSMMKEETL